jgi:hypothetical protein
LQKKLSTDADENKVQEDSSESASNERWLKPVNKCIQKLSAGKPEPFLRRMQTVSPEDVEIYSQEGSQHLLQDEDVLVEESSVCAEIKYV